MPKTADWRMAELTNGWKGGWSSHQIYCGPVWFRVPSRWEISPAGSRCGSRVASCAGCPSGGQNPWAIRAAVCPQLDPISHSNHPTEAHSLMLEKPANPDRCSREIQPPLPWRGTFGLWMFRERRGERRSFHLWSDWTSHLYRHPYPPRATPGWHPCCFTFSMST